MALGKGGGLWGGWLESPSGSTITAMTAETARLLESALRLPADERQAIALALFDSVHGPKDEGDVGEAWSREIARRLDEFRAGRETTRRWDEIELELLAQLAGR